MAYFCTKHFLYNIVSYCNEFIAFNFIVISQLQCRVKSLLQRAEQPILSIGPNIMRDICYFL